MSAKASQLLLKLCVNGTQCCYTVDSTYANNTMISKPNQTTTFLDKQEITSERSHSITSTDYMNRK